MGRSLLASKTLQPLEPAPTHLEPEVDGDCRNIFLQNYFLQKWVESQNYLEIVPNNLDQESPRKHPISIWPKILPMIDPDHR
jgi:hypothetical protein